MLIDLSLVTCYKGEGQTQALVFQIRELSFLAFINPTELQFLFAQFMDNSN